LELLLGEVALIGEGGVLRVTLAALIGGLTSGGLIASSPEQQNGFILTTASSIYGYGWTLVIAAIIIFIVIYLDLFALIALLLARVINFIPGLRGRFGPDGSSLGWHQARPSRGLTLCQAALYYPF
jgi:hypothetical protein